MPLLSNNRSTIRHLLNIREAGDGLASYYAFNHPDNRTQIITYPENTARATGFITLSRTGFDLFRPLVTMRLPQQGTNLDLDASVTLLKMALPAGQPVIIHTKSTYLPLLRAIFDITSEKNLNLYQLAKNRFEPVVNVFVTQSTGANGLPRFQIRNPPGDPNGEILASAGINWQSPHFADISVNTNPRFRRKGYGRSVVAALVQHLLNQGRHPLYVAQGENTPSIELAQSIHFTDTLTRMVLLEGALKAN
jgi:GNAT superfamily N-acetyltransferase